MDKIYKENTEQAELGTRQFFSFRDKGQQDNDFWASAISLSLSSSIFLTIPTLSLLSSSFPYSRVLIQSSSFPFPHNSPVFSVHVLSLSFLVHSKYSSIPSPFFSGPRPFLDGAPYALPFFVNSKSFLILICPIVFV